MNPEPRLVSHRLCPYVQRAAIVLAEHRVAHRRVTVDLADKPAWFLAASPLGRVPVLLVGDVALFESAVIAEYVDETAPQPLHPGDPLERARHRAFVELASAVLDRIAALYRAPDEPALWRERDRIVVLLDRVEDAHAGGRWFAGERFSLVDAAFAPVFRYFDVIERYRDPEVLVRMPRLRAWRAALAQRPSVAGAVDPRYPDWLHRFFTGLDSALGGWARDWEASAASDAG